MLLKPTILDTQIGIQTNFRSQLIEAVSFLLKNSSNISVFDKDITVIKSLKTGEISIGIC